MKRRIVAHGNLYRRIGMDTLQEGRSSFVTHFRNFPNRVEMNNENLNRLLQESSRYTSIHNIIADIEEKTGMEIVIDDTMKDDAIHFVWERREYDSRVRMSEPAKR